MRILVLTCILCALVSPVQAQRLGDFPPDVQAVMRYIIMKDTPEQYGDFRMKLRPRGYEVVDIDQDGTTEVFFWSAPHFHQTAPILIYQVVARDSVIRIKEALAPGPLVAASGKQGDSHKTGHAADTRFETASRGDKKAAVQSFIRFGMQVVEYPNFYHTGTAGDKGGYIDMQHQGEYLDESLGSCSSFQFSNTAAIISGRIGPSQHKFFVALTGETMDIYRIRGMDRFGMLDKIIWRVDAPADFNGFVKGVDESVRYWNSDNEQVEIQVDFDSIFPISGMASLSGESR